MRKTGSVFYIVLSQRGQQLADALRHSGRGQSVCLTTVSAGHRHRLPASSSPFLECTSVTAADRCTGVLGILLPLYLGPLGHAAGPHGDSPAFSLGASQDQAKALGVKILKLGMY